MTSPAVRVALAAQRAVRILRWHDEVVGYAMECLAVEWDDRWIKRRDDLEQAWRLRLEDW